MTPDHLTKLTPREAIDALRAGWIAVFGTAPKPEPLCILAAQSALETGKWQSMHCHNFGNVRAGKSYRGKVTSFTAGEIIDGKEVILQPGANNLFRAYDSAVDGAADFIAFLGKDTNGGGNRYEKAWAKLEAGDVLGYSMALYAAGYFTASEKLYRNGLVRLMAELGPIVAEVLGPVETAPSLEERVETLEERVSRLEKAQTDPAPAPEECV